MSFIAVLFIILFVPLLDGLFSRKQLQRHWLLRWVWGLVMASVAAQLGTAPLVAFYFGRFSCYFLLSNFIVVLCATVILYAALLLLFCFFAPQVQLLVGKALMFVVGTMNTALHWVAHLKGAIVEELHPNVLQVLLSYVFLFFSNRTNLK